MSSQEPNVEEIMAGDTNVGAIRRARVRRDYMPINDTAQAVAIEREAIAGWLIRNAHSEDMWAIDDMLTAIAQAIRNGEHVKP